LIAIVRHAAFVALRRLSSSGQGRQSAASVLQWLVIKTTRRLQLHPPTAVTHCASAWFTKRADSQDAIPNLLVAKHTRLEVYDVR
jgi:hypothetical protein